MRGNGITLLVLALLVSYEAVRRLISSPEIEGGLMLANPARLSRRRSSSALSRASHAWSRLMTPVLVSAVGVSAASTQLPSAWSSLGRLQAGHCECSLFLGLCQAY
jgi:hypothetical protein